MYHPFAPAKTQTMHKLGLPYLMSNYRHLKRFIFFLIFKDPGNLRKALDKKVKSSQDLDESFSSLQDLDESFSTLSRLGWVIFESSRLGWVIFESSRLGWVIFNSLKTWMSHFNLQDLDEVWHPFLVFWIRKDSGNLRKALDWKGPRPAPGGKHA